MNRYCETDRHAIRFFCLSSKALGTLDRLAHHLSYQGDPKPPPHIFFVLTNWIVLTWGRLCLKTLFLSQCCDVSSIGHWQRAIYLCDRKTDRLTDRQTGRQTDIFCCTRACRPHITVCRWTVSKLSVNCLKKLCVQSHTSRK